MGTDSWTVKRACHFLGERVHTAAEPAPDEFSHCPLLLLACFLSLLPLCCLPWPMPATSRAPRVVCAIPTLATSATRCVRAATANFRAVATPPVSPVTQLQLSLRPCTVAWPSEAVCRVPTRRTCSRRRPTTFSRPFRVRLASRPEASLRTASLAPRSR